MSMIVTIDPGNTNLLTENGRTDEILVTKGKLILVPALLQYAIDKKWNYLNVEGKYYFPFIISELEKFQEGDLLYDPVKENIADKIFEVNAQTFFYAMTYSCRKILATPENFNGVYRGRIRNKILKDGDEVYIRCELESAKNYVEAATKDFKCYISYDYAKDIKLYSIKEKSYTKDDMILALENFGNYVLENMRLEDIGGTLKTNKAKNWFEENIE
jgi:hypothetical protein